MPFFQVRQRVYPSCQYRLRSAIKAIVAIEMNDFYYEVVKLATSDHVSPLLF